MCVAVVEMTEEDTGVDGVHFPHMLGHMDTIRCAKRLEKAVDGSQWFGFTSAHTSASTPLTQRAWTDGDSAVADDVAVKVVSEAVRFSGVAVVAVGREFVEATVVHVPHMLGHMTAMCRATTLENAVDGSHWFTSTSVHTSASMPVVQRVWTDESDVAIVVVDAGATVVPLVDARAPDVVGMTEEDAGVDGVHLSHMFGHMDTIRCAKRLEKAVDGSQWFGFTSAHTSASTPLAQRAWTDGGAAVADDVAVKVVSVVEVLVVEIVVAAIGKHKPQVARHCVRKVAPRGPPSLQKTANTVSQSPTS